MAECIFEARVIAQEDGYIATVESLALEVKGDSVETANRT